MVSNSAECGSKVFENRLSGTNLSIDCGSGVFQIPSFRYWLYWGVSRVFDIICCEFPYGVVELPCPPASIHPGIRIIFGQPGLRQRPYHHCNCIACQLGLSPHHTQCLAGDAICTVAKRDGSSPSWCMEVAESFFISFFPKTVILLFLRVSDVYKHIFLSDFLGSGATQVFP